MAIFTVHASANLHQAPPHLNLKTNDFAVFVDFTNSNSKIIYDLSSKKTTAVTTITFEQVDPGRPIFDLVPNIDELKINGSIAQAKSISMNGTSQVQYIDQILPAGKHTMEVRNQITKNVSMGGWWTKSLKAAFWMSDLSDRRYIEQYLPANLEYDQYPSEIEYLIKGSQDEHVIYTNGEVTEIAKNHWKVQYPATYSASSYFMHITKKGAIPVKQATYRSIDGRDIPVTVYTSQSTSKFMNATLRILKELEGDYGPWPHAQVIVYGAGQGGMEHCGATITSFSALGHELIHSYFARGVMPAHGNSGWVDEAIASWRDASYYSYGQGSLTRTSMAGHSVYRRTTDRSAYSSGMRFIGHLHQKFKATDSFKHFLKDFFQANKFKPFKTHEFKQAIEEYYNTDVSYLFNTYIYGKEGVDLHHHDDENPMHPKLTDKELFDLL